MGIRIEEGEGEEEKEEEKEEVKEEEEEERSKRRSRVEGGLGEEEGRRIMSRRNRMTRKTRSTRIRGRTMKKRRRRNTGGI